MKKFLTTLSIVLFTGVLITSCSEDENLCDSHNQNNNPKIKTISIETSAIGAQYDEPSQTGDFTKFSFKEGKVVTNDNWDFAIRGRLILINGRADEGDNLVFGANEPARTKEVAVVSVINDFENVRTASGFVGTDWEQDYHYGRGYYDATAPAISFETDVDNVKTTRQPWLLRPGTSDDRDGVALVLRPVVFIFKTQDGGVAKMKIEKLERTNDNFAEKEDCKYKIKYIYNADGISLDESK